MTWTPYEGDEPTALAYTPDEHWFMARGSGRQVGAGTPSLEHRWNLGEAEGPEMTVALAVESARRWARRTDLSPELRLRRMWQVLVTALKEEA